MTLSVQTDRRTTQLFSRLGLPLNSIRIHDIYMDAETLAFPDSAFAAVLIFSYA